MTLLKYLHQIVFILALTFCFGASQGLADAQTSGDALSSILVSDIAAAPGQSFFLPVSLQGARSFFSLYLVLSYDPNVISIEEVVKGKLLEDHFLTYKINNGQVVISIAGSTPLKTDGQLLSLGIKVSSSVSIGTQSSIGIVQVEGNESGRIDGVSGSLSIIDPDSEGTGAIDGSTALARINMDFTSSPPGGLAIIPIRGSDLTGLYSALFAISYDSGLIKVNRIVSTALTAQHLISSKIEPGLVTISLAGARPLRGGGVLAEIHISVSPEAPLGEISRLRFESILVNEGGIPTSAIPGQVMIADVPSMGIDIPSVELNPGSIVDVPIKVSQAPNFLSGLITLQYDPLVLTPIDVKTTDLSSNHLLAHSSHGEFRVFPTYVTWDLTNLEADDGHSTPDI